MSKIKTAYFCSNCGQESAKWLGKCPACNEWNTFVEEVISKDTTDTSNWKEYNPEKRVGKTISLNRVSNKEQNRIETPDKELDRVLGGGIVPGSIILVAGEPGIGK